MRSLLSCFNKIFEKLVFKRLKSFIGDRKIISSSQYGFRQGHSTEHALLDIVNAIQSNMDTGKFSCGTCLCWPKKAFDTVDHGILLPNFFFLLYKSFCHFDHRREKMIVVAIFVNFLWFFKVPNLAVSVPHGRAIAKNGASWPVMSSKD